MTSESDLYTKSVLVLGCGNLLFGDDGFGPQVADYLIANCSIPHDVAVINIGTSARELLFDLILSETRPKKIIIVDAVDCNRTPGELFELSIDALPDTKIDDFSMHQVPSSNLLRELKNFCGVDIEIIACQVERIPENVEIGLSTTLQQVVQEASKIVMNILSKL